MPGGTYYWGRIQRALLAYLSPPIFVNWYYSAIAIIILLYSKET